MVTIIEKGKQFPAKEESTKFSMKCPSCDCLFMYDTSYIESERRLGGKQRVKCPNEYCGESLNHHNATKI